MNRYHGHRLTLALLVLLGLNCDTLAQDWPQWRGPGRDGVVPDFVGPRDWPRSLREVWKAVVGEGHSGPVVAEGKVYQFARLDEKETLICIEADTGKELWRGNYEAPYKMNSAAISHGKGPKSTPLVHAGKVYTLGISGILVCWDAASGKVVWRKDFARQFTETSPLYGTATSPIAHEGLVIAHVGGHGKGAMTAFDAATGEVKWEWTDDGPGYASPVVAKLAGETQLITQTQDNVIGLSPTTGKTLWRRGYETEYTQNIITPVLAGEQVIYSGYNKPLAALRVIKMEDRLTPQDAWNNRNHPLYMSTPVVKDERIYGFSQRNSGHVFCVDAKSGRTVWQSDGRLGNNASLILAGRFLLVHTTDGGLYVLRTEADEFLVAAKYQLGSSPTWAHPAVVKDRIWIKDKTTLYCLTWK